MIFNYPRTTDDIFWKLFVVCNNVAQLRVANMSDTNAFWTLAVCRIGKRQREQQLTAHKRCARLAPCSACGTNFDFAALVKIRRLRAGRWPQFAQKRSIPPPPWREVFEIMKRFFALISVWTSVWYNHKYSKNYGWYNFITIRSM